MSISPILYRLRARLIVSCQADEGMPMRSPSILEAMARTVVQGGAAGVRVEAPETIRRVREGLPPEIPVIGLFKQGSAPGVFITPTLASAQDVVAAEADVVALDATDRPRPDGHTLRAAVECAHARGRLVLGDVASLEDARFAVAAGVDAVATTLRGYTEGTEHAKLPDFAFIRRLALELRVPVFAEGHIETPADAARALESGAFAVVVGSAITRPEVLTRRFAAALDAQQPARDDARTSLWP